MEASNNRLVCLGTFLIFLTGFGSGLRIATQPEPFTDLTTELNISCIADDPTYLTTSIISIEISKNIEDKPIATVNMHQEMKMADGVQENFKAQGHIEPKSNTSHLTLMINKPQRQDAGPYRCKMFFLDDNFQVVEKSVIGNVNYKGDYEALLQTGWKYYAADKTYIKAFGTEDRDKELTWSKARESCQSYGGDLVQIHDEAKNNFVHDLFDGSQYWPWIGIKNTARLGLAFKYVDGSDLGSYHPWYPGSPYGDADNDWKCVNMSTHTSHHPGKWVDWACSGSRPYVCSVSSPNVF